MAKNKPLNSAEDAVAAAEAELKAAQEKLEAAKAKLAAEANDAKKADGADAAEESAEASAEEPVEQEAAADEVVDVVAVEASAVILDDDVPTASADSAVSADDEPAVPVEAAEVIEAAEAVEPMETVEPMEAAEQEGASSAPEPPAPAASENPQWVPYSTAQVPPYGAPAQQPSYGAPQTAPQVPASGSYSGYSASQQPGYAAPQAPHAGPGAVPPQQPYYGYQQPYYQQPYAQPVVATKDHVAAGLLAIFLGWLGIHKFYLGYNTSGFVMLGVSILGGILTLSLACWVIWVIAIIEGIIYLTKSQSQFEQIYVLNKKEWF